MNTTLIDIGAVIGSHRLRKAFLGRGDVVWNGFLALIVRVWPAITPEAAHEALAIAWGPLYDPGYLSGQLALVSRRMARGETLPGWGDLVKVVPELKKYTRGICTELGKIGINQ